MGGLVFDVSAGVNARAMVRNMANGADATPTVLRMWATAFGDGDAIERAIAAAAAAASTARSGAAAENGEPRDDDVRCGEATSGARGASSS